MRVKGDKDARETSKVRKKNTEVAIRQSELKKEALAYAHSKVAEAMSAPVPKELTPKQVGDGVASINRKFSIKDPDDKDGRKFLAKLNYSVADVLAHRVRAAGVANIVFNDAAKYPIFDDSIKLDQQQAANHPALMAEIHLKSAINAGMSAQVAAKAN